MEYLDECQVPTCYIIYRQVTRHWILTALIKGRYRRGKYSQGMVAAPNCRRNQCNRRDQNLFPSNGSTMGQTFSFRSCELCVRTFIANILPRVCDLYEVLNAKINKCSGFFCTVSLNFAALGSFL